MLDILHAEEGSNILKVHEFKGLVEKESRKQVKALRRNNGGEYISNEFKDFCSREGI